MPKSVQAPVQVHDDVHAEGQVEVEVHEQPAVGDLAAAAAPGDFRALPQLPRARQIVGASEP